MEADVLHNFMCLTGAIPKRWNACRYVRMYIHVWRFIELSINEKHSLDEGVTVEAPICVFLIIIIYKRLDMIAFRIC